MGTGTALALLLKGYNVNLISWVFPEKSNIFNGRKDHMASQIAGGIMVPLYYDRGGSTNNDRMITESWNILSALESSGK